MSALGQRHSLSINYKPSFSYLGKQHQNFEHDYFTSRKGRTTFKYAVNLLYNYQFSSEVSISTGVEYAQQGQNIRLKINTSISENKYGTFSTRLNFTRVPLLIQYRPLKNNQYGLSVYSGVSVGFSNHREDNYNDIIPEAILLAPSPKRYKNYDIAIPMGINLKRSLSKNLFANLGLEYMQGLTNSFTKINKFGVLSEFSNSRLSRLSLNIGLGLALSK
jgi:hypothetical protein